MRRSYNARKKRKNDPSLVFKGTAAVLETIARAGFKVVRWIPVGEALPTEPGIFLVQTVEEVSAASWDGVEWYVLHFRKDAAGLTNGDREFVTHWAKLPEGPND